MKHLRLIFAFLPLGLWSAKGNCQEHPFRIVAYFSSWGEVSNIPFDDITTLDFAFFKPNADGTFANDPSYAKLTEIVSKAKSRHVAVVASIGGQHSDLMFAKFTRDSAACMRFVHTVMAAVNQYQLDGIDLDWEYPSMNDGGQESRQMLNLVHILAPLLHKEGKTITMAVSAKPTYGNLVLEQTISFLDYVNIMAYDQIEDPSRLNHSSYEFAVDALNYWLHDRHIPREKAILGVPTYGRSPKLVPPYYKDLIRNGANPDADSYESRPTSPYKGYTVYYNGLGLIGRKVDLALKYGGGIMIWEVNGDTNDPSTSIIHAIAQKALGKSVPGGNGPAKTIDYR